MKVTEKAKRPGRPGELCFYCGQPVGAEHLDTCVNISKTVVVRMIIDYEIRVPAHWNAHDVEFHRNEGTWCANTAVDKLDAMRKLPGCLCNAAHFQYIKDATEAYLDE